MAKSIPTKGTQKGTGITLTVKTAMANRISYEAENPTDEKPSMYIVYAMWLPIDKPRTRCMKKVALGTTRACRSTLEHV